MFEILDLDKLRQAHIDEAFFPYCQVDCFIKPEALVQLLQDFPNIKFRGNIPVYKLKYGDYFQKLVHELYSPELRALIAEKFSMDLSHSQTMLTVRGQTNSSDGAIHTDMPSNLMTLLLYFNEEWKEKTGNLRLLKDPLSLENYFEEVMPTAGKLVIFKVTDNCWHGHYPYVGKRRALQLNYVTDQKIVDKEMKKNERSFALKKLAHKLCSLGYEKDFVD
jgi:SM-20-related protein